MKFTPDQEKVIEARNCDLLVSAAAGSGKTAVLVERIIRMLSDADSPIDIDQLLVVTFTKAAAAQMKEKIEGQLERKLLEHPNNEHYIRQINYMRRANILTIDSFCYKVVKEHFYLLGIDPGIRVGDAGEMGLLRREVLEQVMEEFYEKSPDFVRFSDAFSADKNDEKIEDYILKIYDVSASYPRPFLWTKTAREQLAPRDESELCNLAYAKDYFAEIKSSAEGIRQRILLALEQVRSIDGPAYMEKAFLSDLELVDCVIAAKTYTHFFNMSNPKFANIGRGKKGTYDEEMAEKLKQTRDGYKKELKELLAAFELPLERVLFQQQEQAPMLCALLDIVDSFRNEFLNAKLERNVLEFSDVEHFALQVLCEDYDADGLPVPSRIAKEYGEQFLEILIDEYQDSNFLQEAILGCVSKHYLGGHNMFMVGDVKQSIYSFRMARPDLFMEKYHSYEEVENAGSRKLLLKNNFRSRANVLAGINYMFYQLMGEELGGIEYTKDQALVPGIDFSKGVDDSVEILIGESKNYDFLTDGDLEMTPRKEENLDEELEDIGRMELEASMIAQKIRELMGGEDSERFMVSGKEGERPLSYGDIVLLLRAPAAFSMVFSETLMNQGIPVTLQNEKGYFDKVEIRTLISLLRSLDNPLNEVEFAAVLRGCFCGLTSDELAVLVLIKRYSEKKICEATNENKNAKKNFVSLFDIVYKLAEYMAGKQDAWSKDLETEFLEYRKILWEGLLPKCHKLYGLFATLKKLQREERVSDLLVYIYDEAGYASYVEVMPEGKRRLRNLELFLTEARDYEAKHAGSLFAFLSYVDRLEEKAITLGGDPSEDNDEDAVRIMSIHKSKGLEFPVVFLAGMGKKFNRTDVKTPLIIHSDYYLAAKYRNVQKRCGNDSFSRKAVAARMLTENIAEELRIFYVGLTRAKDKLILTGVTPDIVAQVKKYENVASLKEQKLSYSVVHTAESYLDFTVMSMIRNPAFCEGMKKVRKRMDKKGEHILSAEYQNKYPLVNPKCNICVRVYDFENLLVGHMRLNEELRLDRFSALKQLENAPKQNMEEVKRVLSWKYQDIELTRQKSKLSVTEIKRLYETDFESSDILNKPERSQEQYNPPLPEFIAGKQPLNALQRGTWVHKTMELFDFAGIETKEQIDMALEAMQKDGRIIEQTKDFIKADMIWELIHSELGGRMRMAAKNGKLYKEKQFVVGVPVSRLLPEYQKKVHPVDGTEDKSEERLVVVQGIMDAYFEEDGKLILLDYKTDHVKPGQEELLKKRYDTQMRYYRDTLEQLMGMEVTETYIYSFSLNKAIRLF